MIGDGINDAVALESADIAMAIGNGSDIAISSANIILTNNDLYQAYVAYELSKKTIQNIKYIV
jgi:Cu+-exporting ATPase